MSFLDAIRAESEIESEALRFPAFRGRQGGKDHYVAILSLADLLSVLPAEDKSKPPELRAQRALDEARAHQIADYVALDGYTLPAITISASRIALHADGEISIPKDASVHCSDGQHRRRAIEIAVEENPDRASDTVACIFHEDADLASIRIQKKYPGFGGREKRSYESLAAERDTRLAIEAALKAGQEPVDDGRLDPKRFKLVVRNERSYLAKESKAQSCACEASYLVGEEDAA